jgi:dipeptidyl aminopeptidase/acylaminoacyl peptidase
MGKPVAAPAVERLELAIARAVTGNPPRRDLVIVGADGRNMRELATDVSLISSRPAWSPDGGMLAFTAATDHDDSDEATDLVVVDADGGNARRLTRTGRAFAPVWSPDGRTIVFAERARGPVFPLTATIWAIGADGGGRRRLLEGARGRFDVPSSFSPDGSQLAFTRWTWREGGGAGVANPPAIYRLDTRSLEPSRLAERAADPAFSPDGAKIAYVSDRDENGELAYGDKVSYANELYVMGADGEGARRLTRTRDLNERAPSWSPDGGRIAYERGEVVGNAEGTVVLTVRPDGSCPRRIAFDPGLAVWYRGPVWRPGRLTGDAILACAGGPTRPALVPLAGNLTLADARRFRRFGLYWVGHRFEQFVLSSISREVTSAPGGRGPVVSLFYGGFQIQLWPACARVPAHVHGGAEGRISVRGVGGFVFEGGNRLEVVTGRTTIVIFGERGQIVRVARALRPLNPRAAPGGAGELPPPVPGALAGELRCR